MTFSEYFNALYPYLSDGDKPADFFDSMIGHFIYEEAQESCDLLACKPDTKGRYIRKNNPNGLYIDNPVDWSRKWDEQGLVNERNVNYAIDGLSEYYQSIYTEYSDVEIWELVRGDIIQFSINALRIHPINSLYVFFTP